MHKSLYAAALLCALTACSLLIGPDHAHAAVSALQGAHDLAAGHGHGLTAMAMTAAAGAAYERKEAAPADPKDAIRGFMTAFEEFKTANDNRLKEVEKKGASDPLFEEKLRKLEAAMDGGEGVSAKLVALDTAAKQAALDLKEAKENFEKLELKLKRPGASSGADPREVKQARNNWAMGVLAECMPGMKISDDQKAAIAAAAEEFKSLAVANDTTGGYLAPSEYVFEILKTVTEISAPRQLVRVRSTGAKSIMVPKRTGQFAAQRTAEQGTRTETDGLRWGMVEITAPEMFALIDISQQNLEDSAFDLEGEISFEATEQFAVKEGAEFVSGGVGGLEGILVNASIAETVSGTATTIKDAAGQADGLIMLKHGIKTAYARNATWAMNRTTLGSVRRLKDGQGAYIWMPGIAVGRPNTIDGDPYVEVPDMPVEGAGAYPIVYGDFMRAYTMVDRVAMQMLRDPYTQATGGNIRFLFRRRVGGAVVMAEALRKLKCST